MSDEPTASTASRRPGNPAGSAWYVASTAPAAEAGVYTSLRGVPAVEELLLAVAEPALEHLPAHPERIAREEYLIGGYVLFRAAMTAPLCAAIERIAGVGRVLGCRVGEPSRVESWEMQVLREAMGQWRSRILGPVPTKGRLAVVVEGPLAGAEGIVTGRSSAGIRIAAPIRFLNRACEITVAPELVVCREYLAPEGHRPRHRSGARVRRSRRAA